MCADVALGFPQSAGSGVPVGGQDSSLQCMTATLVTQLVARAMTLGTSNLDDVAAIANLRDLACGDEHTMEQAIGTCLAQPVSLAVRHRAIELLARARYEDPSLPPERPISGSSLSL